VPEASAVQELNKEISMKIIVPMAGMGKRMRPHTLTVPKPLIPIAGKTIVHRLVSDIADMSDEPITHIGFVVGHFGEAVEKELLNIAESLGAVGSIHYQEEALGTAHAILCAKELLDGKVIVAFADTLFRADFRLDEDKDGVLFVQKIEDPSQFGVVELNQDGHIVNFVEKPSEWVSDLAMIGIYFFKQGEVLKSELQYLIDQNIIKGGEYQLPDALKNMTKKGMKFAVGQVNDWMDCGNKNATVETNKRVLGYIQNELEIPQSLKQNNSVIIPPCYIGENVELENAIVGPYVSLGDNSRVENSVINNSIIQTNTQIKSVVIGDSMIGNHTLVKSGPKDLSLGDYSTVDL
jgi:glucose-1-phosphate thymidylyltransferase